MNVQIARLAEIAAAPTRVIAGIMSGTSLDGLDIALCAFSGSGLATQVRVLHFMTIPYPDAFKAELKNIAFKDVVNLQHITLLNAVIGNYSAELILDALKMWDYPVNAVDVVASHGQTVFHAPFSLHRQNKYPNATLQIGDGDHIAMQTGIITLSDFRQKHVAAGGEGAPLALYGDYLLFSSIDENRILLNIGGISNFTYLPAGRNATEVFSTDVGPGNTLMDQFVQIHFPGKHYDENADIAKTGILNHALLHALLKHDFFDSPFPKTTGPELFNIAYLRTALERTGQQYLPPEDILATLCEFTAQTLIKAILRCTGNAPFVIYISGGGMHNPLLVEKLTTGLGYPLKDTSVLGINADAKEAVLFALLANECLAGKAIEFGEREGVPAIMMGKISLPS